ncbi:MAG: sugar ABC transporter ATP-binding protein, partial [Aquiluna sp.]
MAVEALHVDGVTKSFPGVKALNDVNLSVVPGEVHGIVGENGAGKSTLMSVISGSLIAEEGEVRVFGQLLPPGNASASRDMGVAIVRQEPALLPDLTVAENIYLGVPAAERPKIPSMTAWAKSALAVWSQDLDLSVSLRVEELPPEHRFIVEIVRALAARPKVLILDEPTEHLSAEDVNILFGHIRRLVSENVAVIYISHRVSEVRQIANRVSVLRNGESVGTEAVDKLTEQDIVNLIVGRELGSNYPPKAALEDEAAPNLVVKGLSGEHFSGIDLFVRPGEVVGLAGIDGNGQREFLRALAGFETFTGTVEIDGIAAKYSSVHHAVESGVAYVAADRHREGVISGLSVRDNVALRSLESFKRFGLVSSRLEKASVENLIGRFNVKTPSSEASISNLSGGNQQKTVLAGAFGANPRVLLLDEPTQGVDVGARSEIYSLIRERASETGMAVVVLSTDAKELAGICDRVAVFSRGKVVSELAGKDVTEEKVIAEALGSTAVREKKVITRSATARWLAGDFAPIAIVGVAIAVLATITQIVNPFFLTPMSIQSMLTLLMTLGMAALAQTI